jgi:hypothetical protein
VMGEVVVGIAEDGLLDEQDVAARPLDLVALAQNVLKSFCSAERVED